MLASPHRARKNHDATAAAGLSHTKVLADCCAGSMQSQRHSVMSCCSAGSQLQFALRYIKVPRAGLTSVHRRCIACIGASSSLRAGRLIAVLPATASRCDGDQHR